MIKEQTNIVYEVRGQQVVLDRDLAHLLQMETKVLNQKIKRNQNRFTEDCYFQLTEGEFRNWKSQFVTSNGDKMGLRKTPYAFTEEGVRKLSIILKTEIAINWSEKYMVEDISNIEKMIYEIRGKQVMLDSDLATLYECVNGTKEINQAVKNNVEKFPERFSFRITDEECQSFLVKNFDQKIEKRGGKYKNPRVFTEQGVAMLATILKSKVATQISIQIMDAFVSMRRYIGNNLLEQKYINNQVMKNTEDIKILQESFSKFEEKKKVNEIYFEGQIYSAYSKLLDIMVEAKRELIIIDGYADKITLDMISRLKVKVILVVKEKKLLKELDIQKYNEEFHNLKVIYSDSYHDRYLILDRNKIYHLGASINYAGSRTFSINVLEDEIVKKSLIGEIEKIMK